MQVTFDQMLSVYIVTVRRGGRILTGILSVALFLMCLRCNSSQRMGLDPKEGWIESGLSEITDANSHKEQMIL